MPTARILAAVIATAASAVLAAGASAGGQQHATTLTFDYFCGNGHCSAVLGIPVGDDWLFMGQVQSPKRACRVDRKVEVFEKLDGPGGDRKMGSDRSDSRGAWFVRRPNYPTTTEFWYAKAAKEKLGPGKVCKPDRSPTLAG